jgi:hypothetical protein
LGKQDAAGLTGLKKASSNRTLIYYDFYDKARNFLEPKAALAFLCVFQELER